LGLLLVLGRGSPSVEGLSTSPRRRTGKLLLLIRRRLSRLEGELAEPGTAGWLPLMAGLLPLLLAGLEPRLTGETRLRLDRLGNEPAAGGEDCAGGDCPVEG